MAFFDEIGRKITNAGQSAIQKTQDMASVSKINGQISDEEKKINNSYYQIGKLYVAMHAADCEDDFKGLIASIQESEQKIADCRQQILEIKGVVHCDNCGADVPAGTAFCSSCGAAMPKEPLMKNGVELIRCSGCGAMVEKGMRFCTTCGRPMADLTKVEINNAAPAAQAAPVEEPVSAIPTAEFSAPAEPSQDVFSSIPTAQFAFEPVAAEAAEAVEQIAEAPVASQTESAAPVGRKCPACGADVDDDNLFCTVCGARVE